MHQSEPAWVGTPTDVFYLVIALAIGHQYSVTLPAKTNPI